LHINQETKNQPKEFMVSWLPYEVDFGCGSAALRLGVKNSRADEPGCMLQAT